MTNVRDEIRRLGIGLALHESDRVICPRCDGGDNGEKSLSIQRVEFGLLYNCFRSSCGLGGGIVGDIQQSGHELSTRSRLSKLRRFEGTLVQLPESIYQERFGRYQITYERCINEGIKYASELDRVYLPVFDGRGYQTGEVLRACRADQKPKALYNQTSSTVPKIHFPIDGYGQDLILVEDIVSAIKLCSLNYKAAALLGTEMSDELITYLKDIGIRRIGLMLDGDEAGRRAMFKLGAKLESIYEDVRLIFVPKGLDPKDCNEVQLEEMIYG